MAHVMKKTAHSVAKALDLGILERSLRVSSHQVLI